MSNQLLLNFNTFIKSITTILILFMFVFFVYFILILIKNNSDKLREKIKWLNINNVYLDKVITIITYLLYIIIIILVGHSLYMFYYYNFSLNFANQCNSLVNLKNGNKGDYLISYTMSSEDGLLTNIEYLHDSIGYLIMIVINYYRTLYILFKSLFPTILKVFLSIFLSIFVRKLSHYILDLFGSKSGMFNVNGYTLETLFHQYNTCSNLMIISLILGLLILIIENKLTIFINNLNNSRTLFETEKLGDINSYSYFNLTKLAYHNLILSIIYYRWDILLIVVKLLAILNIFLYINCILFLSLHPLTKGLINYLT